jgi:hypothetical protein
MLEMPWQNTEKVTIKIRNNDMRLTSIAATNFKRGSFKYTLAPITVFVGDNEIGKSSVLEAATLAIAGYLPGIERQNGKIHERLACGNPMAVAGDFDNGKQMSREYKASEDGGVKNSITQRGLNKSWAVDAVLIDANEFLGLSPKARVSFLFNHMVVTGEVVTAESLFAELEKSDANKVEEGAKIIAELKTEIVEDHQSAMTGGLLPQAWIESLIETMGEKKRTAAARQKELTVGSQVAREGVEQSAKTFDRAKVQKRLDDAEIKLTNENNLLTAVKVERAGYRAPNADKEQRARDEAAGEFRRLKGERDQAVVELNGVKSMKCCDKCGAKNKGWRAKIEKVAAKQVQDAQSALEKCEGRGKALAKALTDRLTEIASLDTSFKAELDTRLQISEKAVADALAERNTALAEYNAMDRQSADDARKQRIKTESIELSYKVEVLKAICDAAQTALDGMVTNSIAPFLDKVNALCGGILAAPIAYRNGELGMLRGEAFVTWRSFSGSQKLLFTVGIQIALAAEAELRIAFLDDIGRLTHTKQNMVAQRLTELIEQGALDQALITVASDAVDRAADMTRWQHFANNRPDIVAAVEVK